MRSHSKPVFLFLFGFLILLLASCTPTPYCDSTYTVTKTADTNDGVCSPGDCSLREAVLNANVCPGSHVVNLPAGGYTLSIDGDDEDLGETGDLDITEDLTIIGSGAPSINGNIERAFHIHSGVTATLEGIWLTDGDAIFGGGLINEGDLTLIDFTCNYNSVAIPPEAMGDAMGGCIFNTGDVEIDNGHFLANTAGYGGAIYNWDNASALIEDSSFTGNQAESNGGALWNGVDAEYTVSNSGFESNEAGQDGGAVWNHGDFQGESLVLENNTAGNQGGAAYVWMDTFTSFTNSWLTGNTAQYGGGIYNNNGMVHLYQSGLTDNTATGPVGGGIYNNGPVPGAGLLMTNVTISGNTAAGGVGGGGIYNTGNLMLSFITVANNSPEGIRVDTGVEIKISSSALADNPGGNCAGIPLDSLGHNIDSDGTCGFAGWDDLPAADPLLEPLAFYAGAAPSHALGVGSPAIDSGDPDKCTSVDQHGTSRPQGPWCDRGAHENIYTKGIIRGWTYIDANRDDIRDPAEGAVTGVILELKAGPCPGGALAASTTSSSPGGFYEILDIEPGDYCLDTSPLQQTMYPEYIDLSILPGDVLEEVNFRYLLSPLGDSSLSGKVWHDLCAVPYGTPPTPPPGCIFLPGGGLGADGIYDPSEPGIPGVKVELYGGGCPAGPAAIAGLAYTDANGDFTLPGLENGTWCLLVDALAAPNDSILIPGSWTYPVRDVNPSEHEIVLGPAEDLLDHRFGWDYQFLPAPPIPISFLCIFKENAFGRLGGHTDYPEVFVALEGAEFEVLAKSETKDPAWYFGRNGDGVEGWSSELVLDCKDLDPEKLLVRPFPPLPTPTPTPLTCRQDLNQQQCEAAGGTWTLSPNVTARIEFCACP